MIERYFGRLYVLRFLGGRRNKCLCLCDCGRIREVEMSALKSGKTKSCSCLQKERVTRHGLWNSSEYRVWVGMKDRCHNPKGTAYYRYGGRGIAVCDRWLNSFENFLADMGPMPEGHTVERVDNGKGYCPDNCVWASMKTQQNNRRNNRRITLNGETATVSQWAEKMGIKVSTVFSRLYLGWSEERAIREPVHG